MSFNIILKINACDKKHLNIDVDNIPKILVI